jgi:hypothetical protein
LPVASRAGPKGLRPIPEVGRDLIVRPFVIPPFVCLRLDPDENGAPERVELSGAEALGASQFGFHALDRVLHPELSDKLVDTAPKGAREEALLPRQGRRCEVIVAIDFGHPCRGRLEG